MKTWDTWDENLLAEIPGILPALLHEHLRLAAIEFFTDSWAWLFDQPSIPVIAGTASYAWTPPVETGVVHVLQAWLDKRALTPKTRNELSNLYGDYLNVDGPSLYYIQDLPNKLVLVRKPTSDSSSTGITAKLALVPSLTATGIANDDVADHYFDELTMGTKARLLVMNGKPWTDVGRGQALKLEFEDAAASAKTDTMRSFASTRLRVRAQFF